MPDPLGDMPAVVVAEPTESVRLIDVPTSLPEPSVPRGLAAWKVALAFALVVTGALFMTSSRVFLPDTYFSLYAGRFVAAHGIPTTDPFTVAAHGRTWIDQQWLAHWIYYRVWQLGGDVAVGALSALLIGAAFGVLALTIMRRGIDPVRTVMWATIAFFVCDLNTVIRAQSFAYLLFAALLFVLLEDDRRDRFRWQLLLGLPILILWSNMHGSALMGAGIAVGWALYRTAVMRRRGDSRSSDRYLCTAFAFGASGLVVSVYSPNALIDYYRSVLQNPNLTAYIPEWAPTSFDLTSLVFLVMLGIVLVSVAFALGRGIRPSIPLTALTAVMALGGIHAVRYQVWFAFPAAVLVADLMQAIAPSAAPGSSPDGARRARTLGLAAVLMFVLATGLAFAPGNAIRAQVLCLFGGLIAGLIAFAQSGGGARFRRLGMVITASLVAAVLATAVVLGSTSGDRFNAVLPASALAAANGYAAAHPGIDVLGDDITGPELLWKYPALNGRVGYDARLEIFTSDKLTPFMHFVSLDTPNWAAVMKDYGAVVVSAKKNPGLAERLHHLPGWRVLYSDADGTAVVRS